MTVVTLYRSTIGKKAIMAVTGFIWVGYVILHMYGNLKFFFGETSLNDYAGFLRLFLGDVFGYSGVLWIIRLILLGSIVLHVLMAYQLTRLDLASRPVRYSGRQYLSATLSSRTMRWGGTFLFLFLIYHILHLTTGTVHPDYEELQPYHNLVVAFQNPLQVLIYSAAMVALGLHLYHGIWSMLQTLGVNAFPRNAVLHRAAQALAVLIPVGFVVIPIAIILGVRP
jgi:succinate dehydrogenase / fumarate reductase, cytochrome b subunit